MRFSPLLFLAQAVALSSAFLIPPEISDAQLRELGFPSLNPLIDLNPENVGELRIVRIGCDGCAYKDENVATDLVLNFQLPQDHHTKLLLNGEPLLPLDFEHPPLQPLKATQMPHDLDTMVYILDKEEFPVVTIDNTASIYVMGENNGQKEYTLELSIDAVDGKSVNAEGVQMVIYEDAAGYFSFGEIRPLHKGEGCGKNLKCLMDKLLGKVHGMKLPGMGCGRKGKMQGLDGDMPPHHGNHGHQHGPPSSGHRQTHHNSGPSVMERIIGQVLLPIFVGVLAGMTVSLIGLAVGHALVMMWRKVRGVKGESCRARRERAKLTAQEADGEVEKGLLETEAPPAYADEGIEPVEKE